MKKDYTKKFYTETKNNHQAYLKCHNFKDGH